MRGRERERGVREKDRQIDRQRGLREHMCTGIFHRHIALRIFSLLFSAVALSPGEVRYVGRE